ncbi:NEW3 domain-containing protein [Kineosporia sp. NBRC 101731]|uniref:NEW3 domain-containing protein n=1 Tax=Kineosporia sp. NBRC 101731 TaxID=3032199 RepID=UPI0024A5A3F2|nr:NEW3 domain-containing protein [Kineosporia sp. NBRC 101731]GLY29481.1 hypothetical protein Kisp02_28460 [Kineosporia sp. NBRC 101731]
MSSPTTDRQAASWSGDRATLRVTAQEGTVDAGQTVVVRGTVQNLTGEEVRAVLLARGLPSSWCPPAQVLQLPGHNTAEVFVYLTPPAGTLPGRYLWTLTAQTSGAPVPVADSQLTVRRPPFTDRPQPPSGSARPATRRPRVVAVIAVLLVALLLMVVAGVKVFTAASAGPRARTLAAIVDTADRDANVARMRRAPGPVRVQGTVFLDGGASSPITAFVRGLSRENLSGASARTGRTTYPVTISGHDWSADLPPGIYAIYFRSRGYSGACVMVETVTSARTTLAPVRLSAGGT